jgi:hypothetical protein
MTAPVERFTDNGDGSITDNVSGLMWARQDSWQVDGKWFSWDEAIEYAKHMNYIRLAGFQDWRLSYVDEVRTLYSPDWENSDKYGTVINLHPIFPEGCLPTIWLKDDGGGHDGFIFDFRDGESRELYKSKTGRMAARPVRKG